MQILIVEDEILVAMYLEDLLADLGHTVVATATRLDRALTVAKSGEFDLAVLDVNLSERRSFPVAEILRERGIPFIFATGYGREGIDEAFRSSVIIQKPFELKDLQQAISDVLSGANQQARQGIV